MSRLLFGQGAYGGKLVAAASCSTLLAMGFFSYGYAIAGMFCIGTSIVTSMLLFAAAVGINNRKMEEEDAEAERLREPPPPKLLPPVPDRKANGKGTKHLN